MSSGNDVIKRRRITKRATDDHDEDVDVYDDNGNDVEPLLMFFRLPPLIFLRCKYASDTLGRRVGNVVYTVV